MTDRRHARSTLTAAITRIQAAKGLAGIIDFDAPGAPMTDPTTAPAPALQHGTAPWCEACAFAHPDGEHLPAPAPAAAGQTQQEERATWEMSTDERLADLASRWGWHAEHPLSPLMYMEALRAHTDAESHHVDCDTETGVSVGLIDGLIATCRVLRGRDLSADAVASALRDAAQNAEVRAVLLAAPVPTPEQQGEPVALEDEARQDDFESLRRLVGGFAGALLDKLIEAERKYDHEGAWTRNNWMDECRSELLRHVAKGDPRDVAAYCAFLWYHGERTAAPPAAAPSQREQALREALERVATEWYSPGKVVKHAPRMAAVKRAWPELAEALDALLPHAADLYSAVERERRLAATPSREEGRIIQGLPVPTLRTGVWYPTEDYHEDYGPVLWINPGDPGGAWYGWLGSSDQPEEFSHWTPVILPDALPTPSREGV